VATDPASPAARVAAALRARIQDGELAPGARLPSTRVLVKDFGVAMATATRALAILRDEGLTESHPGSGTFVAGAPAAERTDAPRQGARRGLTAARVADTAVRLADTEGFRTLTTRRIAIELSVTSSALSALVPNREALLTLMTDRAYREVRGRLTEPPPPWRTALALVARAQWEMYNRHPWAAHVTSFTRPLIGGNGMAITDWSIRALVAAGLDDTSAVLAAITNSGIPRGFAVDLERETELLDATGQDADEWTERQGHRYEAVMHEYGLTGLRRMAELPDLSLDRFFEFALERFLDGVRTMVDAAQNARKR
jgi:AcrR family transcriptional regulator